MRLSLGLRQCAVAFLQLTWALVDASSANVTIRTLPDSFKPPSVFENTNLVRNVNLEKSYPRETTNIVVKNVAKQPQSEYFFQFPSDHFTKLSGLDVKDKNKADASFKIELAQHETPRYESISMSRNSTHNASPNSYCIVTFPEPLKPSDSITLSFSYALLSSIEPLPALIEQMDTQTVVYAFSAHFPSSYVTQKQKTKLKLPTSNPAEFTKLPNKNADNVADPVHQGSVLTYGPYDKVSASSTLPVSVRYEFTKPLLHATRFERDVEVSHWGGNLAVEERYWLTNRAAKLKKQFSRVQWQMAQYGNPPTVAAKELHVVLQGGAVNPYYIDDIGNVSTSRFRPGRRESFLDLKPRYPVFGGWNYSFKIGWDANLKNYLRRGTGEQFVLKVPFMEGPRTDAGVEYESVEIRVILPEGAK